MKSYTDARATELGQYIAENKCTVREASRHFGVSKSTVHKDVTERLEKLDAELFREVRKVLDVNKEERHLRGGEATKKKYRALFNAASPASDFIESKVG